MNDTLSWIAEIIARQDGMITRRHAHECGMTPGQIRHLLDAGRWCRVHPGVYRSADHQITTSARLRSFGLWVGGSGVLAGHAAAWWWGLTTVEPEMVDLVVPRRRNLRPRPGCRVIRRDLASCDRAQVRAAPVTGLALSALQGAVALGDQGQALLDRALQTRVGFAEVRSAHYRNLGIRGSARAGVLIHAAADHAAAGSERLFIRLLKDAGIRGWRVNHPWNPGDPRTTIDFAFIREMLAIEIDGWAWHHSPDRFQRDRRKQNDLMNAGWSVLRFTWNDLTTQPEAVIRDVRNALRRG